MNGAPRQSIQEIELVFDFPGPRKWLIVLVHSREPDQIEADLQRLDLWALSDVVTDQAVAEEHAHTLDRARNYWTQTVQCYKPKETQSLAEWFVACQAREELRKACEYVKAWNGRQEEPYRINADFPDLDSDEFAVPELVMQDDQLKSALLTVASDAGLPPDAAAERRLELFLAGKRRFEALPNCGEVLFADMLPVTINEIALTNEIDGHLPLLPPVESDVKANGGARFSKEYLKGLVLDYLRRHEAPEQEIEKSRRNNAVQLLLLCRMRRGRFDLFDHKPELLSSVRLSCSVTETGQSTCREPENVFRLTGEYWEIRYKGGKVVRMRDSLGLQYIHWLLQHPGESFPAVKLSQKVARALPPNDSRKVEVFGGNLESHQEKIDKTTRKQVIDAIDQLRQERPTATFERQNDIDDELEKFESYLSGATHRGQLMHFKTGHAADRASISKAISRAIKAIQNASEPAARHLEAQVRRGNEFTYTGELSWTL
ncbi:MAG: hypothetical protein AB9869_11655 [Verrucomicrobiia bacterium]